MSSTTSAAPRRYRRLLPAQEGELRALWEAGATTAEELAARFGMSRRGVQAALSRLGAKKGAAASAVATVVHRRILAEAVPMHGDPVVRIREAKDAAFMNAVRLEALAMQAAEEAMAEIGGIGALRALDLAASVLARARTVKWAALGLDGRTPPDTTDLPELVIREMTAIEIGTIRRRQDADDRALGAGDDLDPAPVDEPADDVVVEGEDERDAAAVPR
jgi:hypothetical protein